MGGIAAAENNNFLSKTTPKAIFSELDRRCHLKPEALISDEALSINEELEK